MEDQALRKEYEESLAREGMASRMQARSYEESVAAAADKIGRF